MRSAARPTTWACRNAGQLRSSRTWPPAASPALGRSVWARQARTVLPSTPPQARRSSPAWRRTGAYRSSWEPDMADDDDEVIDAEIVDDGDGELTPLIPPDTILTPCHHGCTCGLHQQTVYGERVPLHLPSALDHGEMALLVEDAGHAARLMNDFHDHFRK